jgi:hypothetical protein
MKGNLSDDAQRILENIVVSEWADRIRFWPNEDEGEPDILIELDRVILLIEIKLWSGLSSDDDVDCLKHDDAEFEVSRNQLVKYARMLERRYSGKEKILLLLAPQESARAICKESSDKIRDEAKDVKFGYITWQTVLDGLREIDLIEPYQKVVIKDLIALLECKGFGGFRGFEIVEPIIQKEDVWIFDVTQKSKEDDSMPTTDNIMAAFGVVDKTYESIYNLFWYLENEMKDRGEFKLMTSPSNFLRFKSDKNPFDWLTNDFILLFQNKTDKELKNKWRNGPLYVFEINLIDYDKPMAIVACFEYADMANWVKGSSRSDHWGYYEPLHKEGVMKYVEDPTDSFSGSITEGNSEKYWGLQKIRYIKFALTELTSENAYDKIIGEFKSFPEKRERSSL